MYPEYVAEPGRWLDGGGGRASVTAATLRLADSHGLARGSQWSPGLAGADSAPGPVQHSALAAAGQREDLREAAAHSVSQAGAPSLANGHAQHSALAAAAQREGPGEAGHTADVHSVSSSHSEVERRGADGRGATNSNRHESPAAPAAQPVPAAQPADARPNPNASPSCGSAPLLLQGLAGSPGTTEARSVPHAGAAADPQSPSYTPSIAPAQPPLRPTAGSWAVEVGIDGLLVGAAQQLADTGLGRLLAAVVERGHELSEAEIVRLFDARGADFDAVCSAAGACHVLRGCSARWPAASKRVMSSFE